MLEAASECVLLVGCYLATGIWRTGWDLTDVRFAYDSVNDTAFFGFNTLDPVNGSCIFGDAGAARTPAVICFAKSASVFKLSTFACRSGSYKLLYLPLAFGAGRLRRRPRLGWHNCNKL